MEIPLFIFGYIYLAFLAFYFLFSFFSLFHLLKYGKKSFALFLIVFAYAAVTTIILFLVWQELSGVNWKIGLPIFDFNNQEMIF